MTLTQDFFTEEYAEAAEIFRASGPEAKGAQLVVKVKGETVLDLAAGVSPDSLTSVFSVSKALSGVALAKLRGEGKLDFDQKVAHYWPEFAANGKGEITVRQMLSHQAGLTSTDPQLTVAQLHDDHAAAEALAKQKPLWRPGAMFGYHGTTIGPLMSELVYRITGLTMQQYYEHEVRKPANADAYLGLPAEFENRVKPFDLTRVTPTAEEIAKYSRPAHAHPSGIALWSRGLVGFDVMVSREGRAFGMPSTEGVASARGMVDVMQWATGFGGHTPGVSAAALDDMSQTQVYGYDVALELEHRSFGTLFQKSTPSLSFGSYRAFGHDGAAGSLLYADPIGEIILGYSLSCFTFPGGADKAIQPIIDLLQAKSRG